MLNKYIALAGLLLFSITANAALESRLGGMAYYDTSTDLTWITDANLSATNAFGLAGGISPVGKMSWDTANSWIDGMNAYGAMGYLGYSDWMLPPTKNDLSGITPYLGSFSNVQQGIYWTGQEFSYNSANAWDFGANTGWNGEPKTSFFYTWAVRTGDVSSVPVPAAAWLFGSALIGLLGIKRKK